MKLFVIALTLNKDNWNHLAESLIIYFVFCKQIKEYEEEGRSIVYIDESGFSHDMPRTHGYSMKGTRCYGTHDWGAKGRINAIGAVIG